MTVPRQHARNAASNGPAARSSASAETAEFGLLVDRLWGPDPHLRSAALRQLGALADTEPAVRADVVGAVCAWLRSAWDVRGGPCGEPEGPCGEPEGPCGEPELRRAGLALIADHLRDPQAPTTWAGLDLDLAGAVLTGADLSGCWFTGGRVRLEGAWCIEGRLSLAAAHVTGGHLSLRHWTSGQGDVDLSGARFSGGVVSLAGAVLHAGTVSLAGAVVDGGVVAFTEAALCGATLDLSGLTVIGGTLSLSDARLSAGRVLLVDARLLGGHTVVRHADLPSDALVTAGAQAGPGVLVG
jgi:hypothetical protein